MLHTCAHTHKHARAHTCSHMHPRQPILFPQVSIFIQKTDYQAHDLLSELKDIISKWKEEKEISGSPVYYRTPYPSLKSSPNRAGQGEAAWPPAGANKSHRFHQHPRPSTQWAYSSLAGVVTFLSRGKQIRYCRKLQGKRDKSCPFHIFLFYTLWPPLDLLEKRWLLGLHRQFFKARP